MCQWHSCHLCVSFRRSQHKDTGSLVSSETMTFREMEVRLLPGEVTTMSGSLVWKIPNFSRHLEYARQGIEVREKEVATIIQGVYKPQTKVGCSVSSVNLIPYPLPHAKLCNHPEPVVLSPRTSCAYDPGLIMQQQRFRHLISILE